MHVWKTWSLLVKRLQHSSDQGMFTKYITIDGNNNWIQIWTCSFFHDWVFKIRIVIIFSNKFCTLLIRGLVWVKVLGFATCYPPISVSGIFRICFVSLWVFLLEYLFNPSRSADTPWAGRFIMIFLTFKLETFFN